MFRKAFSISPKRVILLSLNRRRILKTVRVKAGPEYRQSIKLGLSLVAFEEASNPIRDLVVRASRHTTPW